MSTDDEVGDLASRLGDIAEALADVALEQLREAAADPDSPDGKAAQALERRVTRARRGIERAIGILEGGERAEDL